MNWDEFARHWRELRSQMLAMVGNARHDGLDDGARRERVQFGQLQARSGGLVEDDSGRHIQRWATSSLRNADSKSNNQEVE
jgi:hypothetical protein